MTLNEFLDEQEQVESDRFVVDDEQKANWALRKIKEYQQQIIENDKLADDEIRKIEDWRKGRNNSAKESIEYFEGLLMEYALNRRDQDEDFKSISLPNGNFGFRKQQPRWKYDDEALLNYLEQSQMNNLIRTTKAPNKAEIRKQFEIHGNKVINTETGEFVEGIEIIDRPEKFNVRVSD